VFEIWADSGEQRGAISKVTNQLGLNLEMLRKWVNQAEIDEGHRLGLSTDERRHMRELEKENRELRRANEVRKSASVFLRGGARPLTAEVTAFIGAHRERFEVEPICKTLQFAPSTYYDHKSRPLSLWAGRFATLRAVGEARRDPKAKPLCLRGEKALASPCARGHRRRP